jgi:DNA polymerase III delta prime subunit
MSQSYIYESSIEKNIYNFAQSFLEKKLKYNPDYIKKEGKIQIQDIRDIKQDLKYKSFSNTHRVILINIDSITLEAQNSMLKILEETNTDTTIIIAINNHNRLLDTIVSRCIIDKDIEKLNTNYNIKSFINMDIEDRLRFIESIDNTQDFIINLISYIIRNYNSIDNVTDKLKKLNEIQKSIQNNISSKLLLIDISLNM